MKKIRVAVVDDSSFMRKAVVRMLAPEPRIVVVGTAASGEELLTQLDTWQPDVVTLDLFMPGMGGLRTLDRIMERKPLPVILLSSHSRERAPLTIEALHRGAVDFIDKQRYSLVDFQALGRVLIDKILLVTGAHVHPPDRGAHTGAPEEHTGPERRAHPRVRSPQATRAPAYDLLLMGASTGGPVAIREILEDLGTDLRVPAVVVQHMPKGFTRAFAERLNSQLPVPVLEVLGREPLLPSTIYIAPAERHLVIRGRPGELTVVATSDPDDVTHRPSVDVLFSSAASIPELRVVGLLLTGMGSDGAKGMKELAGAGAFTLAQDADTSI
ncbi:MAG: chemotaxis-specific protein-glutamate methyltransferase CheB, partial [Thermoanaerobaculia bacterium]